MRRDVQKMTAACPMLQFTRTRLLYEHVVLGKDREVLWRWYASCCFQCLQVVRLPRSPHTPPGHEAVVGTVKGLGTDVLGRVPTSVRRLHAEFSVLSRGPQLVRAEDFDTVDYRG
jgi:hypothetical protein